MTDQTNTPSEGFLSRAEFLSTDQMKAIYYVALTGSMTKAGNMMCITQSAVTRRIRESESILGVTLFERGDRKVLITYQGTIMAKASEKILYEVDATQKSIRLAEEGLSGKLGIYTFPSCVPTLINTNILSFQEKYPDIVLNLATPNMLLSPLETDVIIDNFIPNNPFLEQKVLYTKVIGMFVHKKYIEKYGLPEKLEDLEKHKLLAINPALEEQYPFVNWILNTGIESGHYQRKAAHCFESNYSCVQAMREGTGICSATFAHIKRLNDPNIVHILPRSRSEEVPVYFIYNKGVKNPDKYEALYEHLRAYCAKYE